MKKIAIACPKGGTGKTTLTQHLYYFLKLKGYKVLMIDLDPQKDLGDLFEDLTDYIYVPESTISHLDLSEYDFVLFDTAPTFRKDSDAWIFDEVDYVISPIKPDLATYGNVTGFIEWLEVRNKAIYLGVMPMDVNQKTLMFKTLQTLYRKAGIRIYSHVNSSVKFSEAQLQQKTLFETLPNHPALANLENNLEAIYEQVTR